jgi:hypothetical protein
MAYVHAFDDEEAGGTNLLGGKGANLAEMTAQGLPVPPGFTITTEAVTGAAAWLQVLLTGLLLLGCGSALLVARRRQRGGWSSS